MVNVTRSSWPLRLIFNQAGTVRPGAMVMSKGWEGLLEIGVAACAPGSGSKKTYSFGFSPRAILPKLLTTLVTGFSSIIAVAINFVIAALVSLGFGASRAALSVPLASLWPA